MISQSAVIIALQKGIDANTNLNEKYKLDLAASIQSNEQLKVEMELLKIKLFQAERDIVSKAKVEDELASLKKNSDSVVAELKNGIEVNTDIIKKCKSDLAVSRQSNEELKMETDRLSRKLAEAEIDVALKSAVEDELASLKINNHIVIAELQKRIEKYKFDLAAGVQYTDQLKVETDCLRKEIVEAAKEIESHKAELLKVADTNTSLNEKYKIDLAASLQSNEFLKTNLEHLGRKLIEAEKEVASNRLLRDELADLRTKSDRLTVELHSEIENLIRINSESIHEYEQLKLELKMQSARNNADVATQTFEVCLVSDSL